MCGSLVMANDRDSRVAIVHSLLIVTVNLLVNKGHRYTSWSKITSSNILCIELYVAAVHQNRLLESHIHICKAL